MIDVDEWIMAAVLQEEFSRRYNCAKAFAVLDTNHDGLVDAAELADFVATQQQQQQQQQQQGQQQQQQQQQGQQQGQGKKGNREEGCLEALRDWPEDGIDLAEFTELLCGNAATATTRSERL
jgi:transcription initiation factor TFIID subunit TAF12